MPIEILTFCGSLRAASSNRALLSAVERLAPDGMTVVRYEDIGKLPHFSPDLDDEARLPEPAVILRERVAAADGLLFAVPEYMHCLPGSFKNALDWMVGCTQFPGKPAALAHVSDRHAFAPDQLREVLRTMSARIIPEAEIRLGLATNNVDEAAILANTGCRRAIEEALAVYQDVLTRDGSSRPATWGDEPHLPSLRRTKASPRAARQTGG